MKRGRGSAKSRSGCQTCKDRRVKCDEAETACGNCLRSGFSCPGYVKPLKWSRKHEVHSNGPPAKAARSGNTSTESAFPLSREARYDVLSADLSDTDSRLPDWLEMDWSEGDAGLAFQDATALMSQDLSTSTPQFAYPNYLATSPSIPSTDFLFSPQGLNTNAGSAEGWDRVSSGDLPLEDLGLAPTANNSKTDKPVTGSKSGSGDISASKVAEDQQQDGGSGPAALLHTLYRLSCPRSLRRLSDDDFVHYYFKHVCGLQSCFDSNQNQFRNLAARWWSTCPTISLTIQSAAIAHISNWYPYILPLGIHKRCQAWRSLQKDLQLQRHGRFELDKALLCLFLLGISACWQQGTHLGLQYLHITRNLIQTRLRNATLVKDSEGLGDLWASALVYWEMLGAFVDPVELTPFNGHGLPELKAQPLKDPVMPHPWNGVATELHFVLAEVGRVSRRRHKYTTPANITSGQDPTREMDNKWLQNLEQLLLTVNIPGEELIQDYGDPATSKMDLVRMAQACRGVGIMELYRLAPDLLKNRISKGESLPEPFAVPDEHVGYTRDIDSMQASIAGQTLNLLSQIPMTSGACRCKPFLLVASASQLRFPDRVDADGSGDSDAAERHDHVVQNRYFVEARMLALSRKLPQSPILRAIDIIKDVWDRLDSGDDGHWVDVMHEKGWQTILG